MSGEGLKEQARRHEQKEEWKQALDLYKRAAEQRGEEDEPDIGLHNRLGDLCVRVGDLDQAVQHYEKAIDFYMEADLPNNAIAVCKKIVRSVPARTPVYLRMARIRAHQGFMPDARQNLSLYLDRLPVGGGSAEALTAVEGFVQLFPAEAEFRLSLAQQLSLAGRADDALRELRLAHAGFLQMGLTDRAQVALESAREMDPGTDLSGQPAPSLDAMDVDETRLSSIRDDLDVEGEFGEIVLEGDGLPSEDEEDDDEDVQSGESHGFREPEGFQTTRVWDDDSEGASTLSGNRTQDLEILPPLGGDRSATEEVSDFAESGDWEEEVDPLPTFAEPEDWSAFDAALEIDLDAEQDEGEDEESDDSDPLPLIDLGDDDGDELSLTIDHPERGADPPAARAAVVVEPPRPTPAPPRIEGPIADGDVESTEARVLELIEREPLELNHRQRLVELAYRRGDVPGQARAYLGLARCLDENGSGVLARTVYRQVLDLDPQNTEARAALDGAEPGPATETSSLASSEEYVDLGALILDDSDEEKTTRFKVSYDEPTGDEQADFVRMLGQFKDSVSQNLDANDVRAHHDLGAAYKEMGLMDEAIEQFQAVLRTTRDHLPTYELLGQCFIETGRYEAALKSLNRALKVTVEGEEDLLGIYYYLGRAYEAAGERPPAVEFYDRVFSLDITFMDVAERLKGLR